MFGVFLRSHQKRSKFSVVCFQGWCVGRWWPASLRPAVKATWYSAFQVSTSSPNVPVSTTFWICAFSDRYSWQGCFSCPAEVEYLCVWRLIQWSYFEKRLSTSHGITSVALIHFHMFIFIMCMLLEKSEQVQPSHFLFLRWACAGKKALFTSTWPGSYGCTVLSPIIY